MKRLALLLIAISVSACSGIPFEDRHGTTHYLILGFGVVSVPKSSNLQSSAEVVKATSLGIALSNQPGVQFSVGYATNTTVLVPDDADDVIIEVADRFWGPMTITTGDATK